MSSETKKTSATEAAPAAEQSTSPVPYRQIRAHYDETTITVYQAYSRSIAEAAIAAQRLDASPNFKVGSRMTWIKPSWGWMLYRAGYSLKDKGQERILAIKMKHEHFLELLRRGVLSHGPGSKVDASAEPSVRIQWDPERTVRLERLPHRSIQIGIPGALTPTWTKEWIVSIEDVTARALELKRVLDQEAAAAAGPSNGGKEGGDKSKAVRLSDAELIERGLVPVERVFEVPDDVREILKMDEADADGSDDESKQRRERREKRERREQTRQREMH